MPFLAQSRLVASSAPHGALTGHHGFPAIRIVSSGTVLDPEWHREAICRQPKACSAHWNGEQIDGALAAAPSFCEM